jgi:hypothetical protein
MDDINLFMIVESLYTSEAHGKVNPRPIFLLLSGTGTHFFDTVNRTIPERHEGLNKTELYKIKTVILHELKDVFVRIASRLEGQKDSDITEKEKEHLLKIKDCLVEESKSQDDFIIDILVKNMITYLKAENYNMSARFMMSIFLAPCQAPKYTPPVIRKPTS